MGTHNDETHPNTCPQYTYRRARTHTRPHDPHGTTWKPSLLAATAYASLYRVRQSCVCCMLRVCVWMHRTQGGIETKPVRYMALVDGWTYKYIYMPCRTRRSATYIVCSVFVARFVNVYVFRVCVGLRTLAVAACRSALTCVHFGIIVAYSIFVCPL